MKRFCLLVGLFFTISSAAFASERVSNVGAPRAATVEIFVTSWCPYCQKLETLLKKNKVDYTRYDVEADAKGAEIFEKLGGSGVPVTRVGNEVIHGYDPERIAKALKARA